MPNYNGTFEPADNTKTLSELRRRLAIRAGYAAQANNLPPSTAAMLDEALRGAQRFLWRKHQPVLETKRIFRWPLEVGERFYAIGDGSGVDQESVDLRLDRYKIEWVGIEDLNHRWYPLIEGIPPTFHTLPQTGYPERYEIRDSIELWPAPSFEGTLRVKGHFGLLPLEGDDDSTTFDAEPILLWALAEIRAGKGHQRQADDARAQALEYLRSMTAGAHGTARYVPGTKPRPSAVQPVMTAFDE